MIKIAIYSRKSVFTGKGESIENQIELCKNYCNTYVNSGSNLEYIIYEDEGFSGKNTNRPEFQHMIDDIKKNKIDTLICYRLDRISRNVADFSSTLELLQKYNVNFISIKERFDTSTPLGRAMIYIASVFAQLERETIAERVRDNMIQLAKSGRWLGGNIPYGFNIARKTYISDFKEKEFSILSPNKKELETVNFVYSYYIKTHSIRQVTRLLNVNSIIGKNGGSFDLTQIRRMLRNPLYVISDDKSHEYLIKKGLNVFGSPNGNGYITYNKSNQKNISADSNQWIVAVSNHKGIITSDNWLKVQYQLDNNKSKMPRIGTGNNHSLFSGILKCKKCGSNMIVKFSGKNKNNIPYEYYV
ncbi:MAG: recombinase family protein, partial [Clostridium butyricum]|nr:recombinase family protein [Clostridium butyricum]